MKMKLTGIITASLVLAFTFGTTVMAAPKTMSDGNVFDAQYYAANNPDVVAAVGSSEAALYHHYLKYGAAEGRLPVQRDPAPDHRRLRSRDASRRRRFTDRSRQP